MDRTRNCGHWQLHACPGGWQGAPVSAQPIDHATSHMEVYNNGDRQIVDTLQGSGFVVTHEYDEIGVVREVLIEDPTSPLAVQIQLDSNGTIREIHTLTLKREGHTTGMERAGWKFTLDANGRVVRPESGVCFNNEVVRSIAP